MIVGVSEILVYFFFYVCYRQSVVHFLDSISLIFLVWLGGRPKTLPALDNGNAELSQHVTLFRNIDDYRRLDSVSRKVKSITIVGGGFLGSELACALGRRGKQTCTNYQAIFPFHYIPVM